MNWENSRNSGNSDQIDSSLSGCRHAQHGAELDRRGAQEQGCGLQQDHVTHSGSVSQRFFRDADDLEFTTIGDPIGCW